MTINTNVNPLAPALNTDGLMVWYGTNETLSDRGHYISEMGVEHCALFDILSTDVKLGTGATSLFVLSYNTYIPHNAFVTRVQFLSTDGLWDSTSSDVTLNFGLIKRSDFTIVSATALVAALPKTVIDTAGASVSMVNADSLPASSTYTGTSVGTAMGQDNLVTAYWTNHAPTAGKGTLRVFFTPHQNPATLRN